jgi:hypothetical protein
MLVNFDAWKMQQRRQKRVVLAPRPVALVPALVVPEPVPTPLHVPVHVPVPAPLPKHIDPELAELIRISKIVSSSVKM